MSCTSSLRTIADMVEIPELLAHRQLAHGGAAGRAFIAELPSRTERFLDAWGLRPAGPVRHGWTALVVPVERGDGSRAVLKLQALTDETEGEAQALRAWGGDGAVRLLRHDAPTGTLLLERLDSRRCLADLPGVRDAVTVIAELLARLTARPAPPGLRRLGDIAADLLDRAPGTLALLGDERERLLLLDCAAALREVADEPGDRLLHWDLHYENVLAAEREPWLAIDPKPLAGDPGFELLPALYNRFDPAAVQWRFDLLTEALGLDRERARAWSLGRVLQNTLWHIEDGERHLEREQESMARTLLAR
ncbi:hydroxyurea phosphotransferase [Streptomyces clavuligerus]|nr:hydroxyurea phosphotransferase [Streptomyces clavuligerus]EDY48052.1 aminoglycoside phosphotransferase [Streptomyces clavuligerus]QCS06343.1 hydroxyurea phosphotransferase [Streptomyces clavuligerus]QPJ94301.1 hydroxyurea phosphotransferase [Streptomyces clavuligerus]